MSASTKPSHAETTIKLRDDVTGLKLIAVRDPAVPHRKAALHFEAPRPFPADLVPGEATDIRAHVDAFKRINDYLKSRIVLLD